MEGLEEGVCTSVKIPKLVQGKITTLPAQPPGVKLLAS